MRTFSLLALPLFALSCATTSPEPIQVDHGIAVPEAWTNATQAAGQVDKAWWKEFGDEHLNQLVEHAFAHSPSLTSAAARVDRAIAQATIAGADVYPHLNAGFSASRQKNVFNFGSGTSSARTNTYGANLTASWEADVWGRIKAGHQAAFADLDAANAAYEGAALSLANQVVRAYFTAVASRMRVARYQESLDNALLIEKAVQNRFEQGQRPITDVELIGATRAGAA
ncbi:MAG: TolC family protein, partial [Planctomycetes bacterium]|nr:TolC family protein [Planctomycetota bacterium]